MKDIIQHSFATDSKVGFACMNIYHYLLNEDLDNLKYITFNNLQKSVMLIKVSFTRQLLIYLEKKHQYYQSDTNILMVMTFLKSLKMS